MKLIYTVIFALFLIFSSCVPKRKIIYLQDIPTEMELIPDYIPKLKPNDLLHIQLKTTDSESSDLFNLNAGLQQNLAGIQIGYLVDKEGNITFPEIGKIKVVGLTTTQLNELITNKLNEGYLKDFYLDVRLANFRVNVLGEVNQPGEVIANGERLSLLEAITRRGDLSIFGNRKNILIVREENNIIKTYTVDLTSSDFMKSDFYFLQQNDVVIVEPRRVKADNTAISGNITTTLSILVTLTTLFLILR